MTGRRKNPLPGKGISRRELLQGLALGCAGLLSSRLNAGTSVGFRQPGGPVREGQALTEAQMKLLRELVETIIPQTDTPGAAETDTHGFIDDQLAHCREPGEARDFTASLDKFETCCRERWNAGFADLSAQDRQSAMTALAHHEAPFTDMAGDFFYHLKALTVFGYYSSEAGASQELVYLPIPGGYLGDFTVADNGGKAFSPRRL